ncbi:tetratricopeptide repeat protein, partial [candidate division KSB1 bacterium]
MKLWHFTLLIICCSTFSDAQNNDSGYFAYLRDIYDQHETELYDFLLQELDRFVLLFPHSPLHADVLYMEASVHSSKGDDVRQFAALLKLLSLYPDFSQYQSCRDDLGILVSGNKTFAPKKADILNFLSSFGDDKDASHRFYRVLEFLISLEMKDLNDWLLEQLSAFQMLYPDYPSIEQSYFWSARIYKSKKQYDEAGAVLGKMEFLHPNSPYIETARLERALLLYQAGSYQSALPVLEELTASESKELQITCYFYLGELYEKKVKDYDKAVHHYTVVVENPAHSMAKAAIDRLADIYQKRLKSPTKAAEINAAYRTLYPQDEKASLYLLKAAELEEKYGAPEKALYYYTQIITAYPNSSEYDQAFSRTKDLKARGVKSTDDGGGVGADHPSHSAADENEAPEKSSSEENAEKHAGIIGAGEHTGMPSDTLKTIDDEAEIAHATIMSAKESQARKDYIEYYLGTQVLDVDWNGSVANCEAGELDPEILRKAELRINYFRRLVGLAEIKLADQYNLYAQHAALM